MAFRNNECVISFVLVKKREEWSILTVALSYGVVNDRRGSLLVYFLCFMSLWWLLGHQRNKQGNIVNSDLYHSK